MFCRRCGEILNANANFCWSCGAPQVASDSPETASVPVVHDSSHGATNVSVTPGIHGDELVVVSGTHAGDRYPITLASTRVGREDDCDLVLDDVSVSRRHAVFTATASGRLTLRDLNSLNGTYVNGTRVDEVVLHSGDEVQIGRFKFVFWGATA
jgi:hypothetical protein